MNLFKLNHIFTLFALLLLSACLPQSAPVSDVSNTNSNSSANSDSDSSSDTVSSGISEVNFFQQGSTSTSQALNLQSDFKDSFLMRGDNLHNFLKDHIGSAQTNLCMAIYFPFSAGQKVLVLGAKTRSFYNSKLGGKEFYLQMEAANETANANDCLNVNLNAAITNDFGSSDIALKIADTCPTCQSTISSSQIKLYFSSGTNAEQVQFNALTLNVLPSQSGSGSNSGITCSSDSVCNIQGFQCCLQNQCVNHGEVKSSVDTSTSAYQSALEQILARPELITNYSEYFYICPNEIPTDPNSGDDGDDTDPDQDAQDLFTELGDLYNCLNPVIDEFSICSASALIETDKIGSGGTKISAGADDITFSDINSSLTYNNIVQVDYAGRTIYKEAFELDDTKIEASSDTVFEDLNDDFSKAQSVTVDRAIPATATNDQLKVYYRVDGTCEYLGEGLARCDKYYVQGQTSPIPRSSDHAGGNVFKLPFYADLEYNVLVEVGGVAVPQSTDTWQPIKSNNTVQFTSAVYNQQEIKITYFVTDYAEEVTASQRAARSKVNIHCKCATEDYDDCNLNPVYETLNGESTLVNYACKYGQPDVPEPPLQETVYLSSKSVPHRYYDQSGVHYEDQDIGSAQAQEGVEFKYTSDNALKPSNQSSYVGFNEIYGSFARKEISAMPAKVVDIKKGTQYDIFVDSGSFSSCLSCGTDYFSNLQKLFPANFTSMGGGYLPNMVESRRVDNQSDFSSSEMKFGRACFVPATMIPWTHRENTNVTTQRQNRLAAQHFLFANGYNRDWYGFDYGSLIGSHDGVRWFSIGNQRRIQAKSNKLYIAINAYFGDLTIDTTFKVVVSELSTIMDSGSAITHDTESDGAQCQKAHYCASDNDCIAQLGYEYTCQNVSGIMTPWPTFDGNGNEISGSSTFSLLSLVGGSNGQVKRCVYRGAGSLCKQDLSSGAVNADQSYASSDKASLHACSPNTYCADLSEASFNDRIARYGNTPGVQNNQSFITNVIGKGDTFGLGARIIGRPFDFYGSKTAPGIASSVLRSNKADAMCVPGKTPVGSSTVADLNTLTGIRKADKSIGIGVTFPEYISQNPGYYAACPATDDEDIFTATQADFLSQTLGDQSAGSHAVYASAQNLSTNALNLSALSDLGIFNDEGSITEKLGYNKATCLRAPGASCYSDMDCSPNAFISKKIKTLTNLSGILSVAEENFWEEELVCANSQERYLAGSIYENPVYELNEHRCCRETGKDFTFATQRHKESDFEVVDGDDPSGEILLPGVNQSISSSKRYSRTHTVYDKLINERTKYPPLYSPGANRDEAVTYDSINELLQYNTLHLNNSRMCCTGNWVRNFATGTNGNGGGHKFSGQTQQRIDKSVFKYLSWTDNNDPPLNEFENYTPIPYRCTPEDWQTSDCEIKNITAGSDEETKWLNWFGKFELMGIPQVMIETNVSEYFQPLDNDQELISPATFAPLEGTVKDVYSDGIVDANYNGEGLYSAASYDNFDMQSSGLKKVFSEDSFSCCVPTGVEVDGSMENSKCCSGQVNTEEGVSRCCLNDFTDVSVYTNRYVSSEGAYFNGQPVSEADIDEKTGYIKKELVLQMATSMCCSGTAAYGVAIGDYFIPMNDDGVIQNAKSRRWLYMETLDDANEVGGGVSKFNAGMKWNNHVYCVPADYASGGDTGGGASQN